MKVIHKYTVPLLLQAITNVATPIGMHRGAHIIHVREQHGVPTFWAEVDPEQPPETRYFLIVGTGHETPDDGDHIGTCHIDGFVWHLYEIRV